MFISSTTYAPVRDQGYQDALHLIRQYTNADIHICRSVQDGDYRVSTEGYFAEAWDLREAARLLVKALQSSMAVHPDEVHAYCWE